MAHLRCNFLFDAIGERPLEQMRGHLAECAECREELDELYEDYRRGKLCMATFLAVSRPSEANFPAGLSKDEFLTQWHMLLVQENEIEEHRFYNIHEALATNPACYRKIQRLLKNQVRLLRVAALRAPRPILVNEIALLERNYRELAAVLGGEKELELLMGGDDSLREVIRLWRRVCLGDEKETDPRG